MLLKNGELRKMHYLIYPGKFDLPHRGHKYIFDKMVMSGLNYKLAVTEKQHVFTVEEKLYMLKKIGIHTKDIIQVKNPYNPISQGFKKEDIVEYVVSSKDDDRFPTSEFTYLQLSSNVKEKHTIEYNAYINIYKTKSFKVLGKWYGSSSGLRKVFKSLDYNSQMQYIVDIFGSYDGKLHDMLYNRLIEENNE